MLYFAVRNTYPPTPSFGVLRLSAPSDLQQAPLGAFFFARRS